MKSKVIAVLILAMALFFVGCEYEGQPTQTASGMDTESLSKKPEKPERITFTGDLSGQEDILGCCPNAGPFPEYTMTLSATFEELSGIHEGNIFMNKVGKGKNKSYMVQFWWTEIDDYFIEIRGGVFQEDKKSKALTATFTDAPCEIWINDVFTSTVSVNFTLTRSEL